MTQRSVTVVVPAYNEERRLESMIRSTLDYFSRTGRDFRIIVVDDGSTDGTSALVRRLEPTVPQLRLIRLAANRGKGYAVRTGILNADTALVLFADADGAAPIEELERLERALDAGADLAIGSRAVADAGVRVRARPLRRVIGRVFHAMVRLLTVRGYRDTQCGFKLFRGPVAQDLFSRLRMNGFSFDVELLMMAGRKGYRVAEVPVNWVHQPGSKVNLFTDSLRMAADLVAIRARALRGDYDEPHVALVGASSPAGVASEPNP